MGDRAATIGVTHRNRSFLKILLGTGAAQDVHLDFHTAPELCVISRGRARNKFSKLEEIIYMSGEITLHPADVQLSDKSEAAGSQ